MEQNPGFASKTLASPPSGRVRRLISVSPARGFSLVELSVALVVIGVILGMVSIGGSLMQGAQHQKLGDYVQGWALAYDAHVARTGLAPRDNAAAPTGKVNGALATPLCGVDLKNAMLAAGVALPPGRAEGSEELYVYQDSHGLPHQLEVCFSNVQWSEPGAATGVYVVRERNVMILRGLTPGAAYHLDTQFDGRVDARFGRLREDASASNTGSSSVPWTGNELSGMGGATGDEAQMVEVTAYLYMNQ